MNTGTQTARGATPILGAVNESQSLKAGFPIDFQDLCSYAMDRALGIEKVSLDTVVSLNSCVIDTCKNAFWFSPALGDLFDTVAQAFASCMELQLSLLNLMGSHVSDTMESLSGFQAQVTAEVLERSMDIAIGVRFTAPISMVAISGSHTHPPAKVAESSAETANEARAS